jgi:phenylacetic acid degradation operon negative regulatory protein
VSAEFVRSPRGAAGPRDRILDLYGAFIRDAGGWIAVADLLELLELFDIASTSSRAALTRMKRRGEIESVVRHNRRGYSLTPPTEEWFRDGTVRIMERRTEQTVESWTLATFSVPEEERNVRYLIRTRLAALGFGQVAGGLMIAPSRIRDEAIRALQRADLTDYVVLWDAEHVGFGSIKSVVAAAWDLDALRAAYAEYLGTVHDLECRRPPADDREAFVRYIVNINAWRELPFLDPGLPLDHLPDGWPSAKARRAFTRLADDLYPAARRHFLAVTSSNR